MQCDHGTAHGPRPGPDPVRPYQPRVASRLEGLAQFRVQWHLDESGRAPDGEQQRKTDSARRRWLGKCKPDRRGKLGQHQRHHQPDDRLLVRLLVGSEVSRADLSEQRVVHDLYRPDETGQERAADVVDDARCSDCSEIHGWPSVRFVWFVDEAVRSVAPDAAGDRDACSGGRRAAYLCGGSHTQIRELASWGW
eukprot:scaffold9113_cov61-Phaeocystis_antarctica.AAC.1